MRNCRQRGAVFGWPRNDVVCAGSRDSSCPCRRAQFSVGLAMTWFTPVAEIAVVPCRRCRHSCNAGSDPIAPAAAAGILGPLLGSSCPGTRYLYAISGVGLDKIATSTIFSPVPLILSVGPTHRLGGPPTLIWTRARGAAEADHGSSTSTDSKCLRCEDWCWKKSFAKVVEWSSTR